MTGFVSSKSARSRYFDTSGMSYPKTVNIAWTVQGGGGGPSGITTEVFEAYQSELNAFVAAAQEVNDTVTGTASTWSSTKIEALLAAI